MFLHDDDTCTQRETGGVYGIAKGDIWRFTLLLFIPFSSFHEITPFMIDSHIISMMMNRREKDDSYLHVYIRHV
jgi:hypothetical protein